MPIISNWNKKSSDPENSLYISSFSTWYGKGIEESILSLNKIESNQDPILLNQSDFNYGTYRITSPGVYKLSEDIVFNPNPGTFDIDTKIFTDDNDWMPKSNQSTKFPSNPFRLGFFAAITVESNNVVIDLNGKNIIQSRAHYLQQRFYSHIELANQPFISTQGPAKFGNSFFAPTNVKIKNGYLGLSSHHGIHGNGMKNIIFVV